MNTEILKEVAEAILAEPKRLDMGISITHDVHECGLLQSMPSCKTVGCIAGWTLIVDKCKPRQSLSAAARNIKTTKLSWYDIETEAAYILGINSVEKNRLFYVEHWPVVFAGRYHRASTPLQRAKVTIDRINHFIKTNGAD